MEVRAMVKERLVSTQAAELAKKDGSEKLAAWKSSAPANLGAALVVSREGNQVVPSAVLDAVLQADTATLPAWVGVDLGSQGYAVARVNQVLPRTPPVPAMAEQERKQYAQWVATAENQAYYKLLTQRFKVQIKAAKPDQAALGK
jgi:peptidyl-prolyl cis-trans isomerase D